MPEQIGSRYLRAISQIMTSILDEEQAAIRAAAGALADQIALNRLVHVYGPGGHSNLAAQEVFFRAGGLMHMSAVLDEGTLLSSGALRSMAMERTPGYGRIVIDDYCLDETDILILVNAYGINAALIDAAVRARELGVRTIGVSSRAHADNTSGDHPARHPSRKNLHDLVDIHVDTKVPVGDALMEIPGALEMAGPCSTFANAFAMNWIVLATLEELTNRGIQPPMWRSGNAPGGDEANARFIDEFRGRVRCL